MAKFASGLVLINAPHSALNMLGIDTSRADRTATVVKKLKRGRELYAYVSAQAWRYWWRQTLKEHFGWELSPLEKVEGKNQVYTQANPIKYPDDDVFGYMRAIEDLTVTRVSPLKNSPLVSVLPWWNSGVEDEAYASRHEGNPVPYSTEFYSTILKGAFSLDLDMLGKFSFKEKAGFRNLINFDKLIEEVRNSKISKKEKEKKLKKLQELKEKTKWEEEYLKQAQEIGIDTEKDEWVMPNKIRAKRATETIKALKYLHGGAKQTLFLTDVTPKFVILALFDGGINPFISDLIYEDRGEILFDSEVLVERLKEFKDALNPPMIFIGFDKGFIKQIKGFSLEEIEKNLKPLSIQVISGNVGSILEKFANEIARYYGVDSKKE